jgi:flagellar motor switch protein FliM
MNVAFPAVASNALLRRLDHDGGYSRHRGPSSARERMMEHALGFNFEFSLAMPAHKLPIRTLLDLAPESVISFPHRTAAPIEGRVDGCAIYEAFPIRAGNQRASKIAQMLPLPSQNSPAEEQESQ